MKFSLLFALLIALAFAPIVYSQSNEDETDSEEGETIAPDYFDEDLFGADTEEDEDEDFFDSLEVDGEGSEEGESSEIDDEDIGALPTVTSQDVLNQRDYSSYWDTAVFRALDKVTGRIRVVDAPLEEPTRFERFEIVVRTCNKRPPEETPNTTAFVEVDELTLDGEREDIFTGWMFASSPGLNAVEHPVYDVWLIDCKRVAPETAEILPKLDEASTEEENQEASSDKSETSEDDSE